MSAYLKHCRTHRTLAGQFFLVVFQIVEEALPLTIHSLEEEQVDIVITKLMDLGVTNLDDCTFLKAEDLDGILPPIQSRQLINAFCLGTLFLSVGRSVCLSPLSRVWPSLSLCHPPVHFLSPKLKRVCQTNTFTHSLTHSHTLSHTHTLLHTLSLKTGKSLPHK